MCNSDELSRLDNTSDSTFDRSGSCSVSERGAISSDGSQLDVASPSPELASDLIMVCSVCLGNRSEDDNEIIFCDNCGYPVHESCYGVQSGSQARGLNDKSLPSGAASTESDDPTEPWFCEQCCSDTVLPVVCELCPRTGDCGLYKRTDQNRWVHTTCAIYNKYVAFHDTDQLWPVDLSDVPVHLYGEKPCAYCEEPEMSRTGACINCEAGLCRVASHVSCAFLLGLFQLDLQGNPPDETPSFYCKQHSSDQLRASRIRRISAVKSFALGIRNRTLSPEQTARKDRLLAASRAHYSLRWKSFHNINNPILKCRPITSSTLAMRLFARKQSAAALLNAEESVNENAEDLQCPDENCHEPTFSTAFVRYFQARESTIASVSEQLKRLLTEHTSLRDKENELLALIDQRFQLKTKYEALVRCFERTLKAASEIGDGSAQVKIQELPENWSLPLRSTSRQATLTRCAECRKQNEQDSLVRCDMCSLSFHIQCLDPPLERVPRRHRSYKWHCATCTYGQAQDETASDQQLAKRKRRKRKASTDC